MHFLRLWISLEGRYISEWLSEYAWFSTNRLCCIMIMIDDLQNPSGQTPPQTVILFHATSPMWVTEGLAHFIHSGMEADRDFISSRVSRTAEAGKENTIVWTLAFKTPLRRGIWRCSQMVNQGSPKSSLTSNGGKVGCYPEVETNRIIINITNNQEHTVMN